MPALESPKAYAERPNSDIQPPPNGQPDYYGMALRRGRSSYDFFPMSIVDLGNDQATIVKQFAIEVDEGRIKWTDHFGKKVVEAYSVFLSPDGRKLYVSHGGLDGQRSLMDTMTGEFVRKLDVFVDRQTVFSSDGRYSWYFRPYLEWQEKVGGIERSSERAGISLIHDTLEGAEESRIALTRKEDNQAALLHANEWGPWETPSGPRVRLERGNLVAYDRDTYEVPGLFHARSKRLIV